MELEEAGDGGRAVRVAGGADATASGDAGPGSYAAPVALAA
ncbi:hypothetical protein [Streptomyces sp. enrichment culture]